jgi:hypothetical protein
MTLFMPDLNYGKSYASVAQQIAARLPANADCIETNVGPAQRASFAYFGHLPFAGVEGGKCSYLLLQDSMKKTAQEGRGDAAGQSVLQTGEGPRGGEVVLEDFHPRDWTMLWEGRRPSDRDERFRLYQRR